MINMLVQILSDPNIHSFLIQYMATVGLDSIKNIATNHVLDKTLEKQVLEVFGKALEGTCTYYGWEYDATAIKETLSISMLTIPNIDTPDSLTKILEKAIGQQVDTDILDVFTQSFFAELIEEKYKDLQTYLSVNRQYRIEKGMLSIITIDEKVNRQLLLKKQFCLSKKCLFYNSHILLSLIENNNGYVARILEKVNLEKFINVKKSLQKAVYFDFEICEDDYPFCIDINNHSTILLAKKIAYNNGYTIVDERILFMALLFSKSNTISNFKKYYSTNEYRNLLHMLIEMQHERKTPEIRFDENYE